jgi:hypothetical protein
MMDKPKDLAAQNKQLLAAIAELKTEIGRVANLTLQGEINRMDHSIGLVEWPQGYPEPRESRPFAWLSGDAQFWPTTGDVLFVDLSPPNVAPQTREVTVEFRVLGRRTHWTWLRDNQETTGSKPIAQFRSMSLLVRRAAGEVMG